MVVDGLGARRFGFWITFTGLALIVGSLDLGVGSGLVTAVARGLGQGEDRLRVVVSSAAVGLALVATLLLGVTLGFAHLLPRWEGFALSRVVASNELVGTVLIVGGAAAAGVVFSIGPRTQQGLQEGDVVGLWQALGFAVQVLLTISAWVADGGMLAFVAAGVSGPVVSACSNSLWLFGRRRHLRPRLADIDWSETQALMSAGALYFALGVSAVVAYQVDSLVVGARLGAVEAAEFGFASRLMMTVPMLVGFFITPLWPAYADAHSRGDSEWMRRTFWTSLSIAAIAGVLIGSLAVAIAPLLIDSWSLQQVAVNRGLLLALFVVALEACVGGPVAMFLNGVGVVRIQVLSSGGMAIVNLALSLWLVGKIGLVGPVVATAVAQPIVLIPSFLLVRRLLADGVSHRTFHG